MKKLTGNVGILTLSNNHGLIIKINNNGNSLEYQWQGSEKEEPIYEAEIEYIE